MTKINDVATHALNPVDQLLHILAHGMKWDLVPPIRWVTDALMIIKTASNTIDWNTRIILTQIWYSDRSGSFTVLN